MEDDDKIGTITVVARLSRCNIGPKVASERRLFASRYFITFKCNITFYDLYLVSSFTNELEVSARFWVGYAAACELPFTIESFMPCTISRLIMQRALALSGFSVVACRSAKLGMPCISALPARPMGSWFVWFVWFVFVASFVLLL